jgi:hypothetical protein
VCFLPHADEPGGQERLASYLSTRFIPTTAMMTLMTPMPAVARMEASNPVDLKMVGGHAILTSGESLAGDQEYAFPLIWDASSDCHSVAGFGQSPLEALLHGRRPEHPTREMDGQFSQTL